MKWGRSLTCILLSIVSIPVVASNIQNLEKLKVIAEDYVQSKMDISPGKHFEINSGKLDPRLRLTDCGEHPTAFTPPGSRFQGNTTVGIRCNSPKPWSIYIPVKVAIYQNALISNGKLARGHIIGENDIIIDEVDISRIRGRSFVDKDQLIGTKLKTSLQPNQILDSAQICLICKGDTVIITANHPAVSVSMSGVALNDGSKGDKIRVQNNASRRIIDAVVMDNSTVKAGI